METPNQMYSSTRVWLYGLPNESWKNDMINHQLTISYPNDLLLSLESSPEKFESEAKLLLAVKLYELERISTAMGAQLAGMSRVAFMFELAKFDLSPIGVKANELENDLLNA